MIEQLWASRGLLQTVVVVGLVVMAFLRGAAPERWCASILLAAIVLARMQQVVASEFRTIWGLSGFVTDDLAYLVIDLTTFITLATVAMQANRKYPLWMAGVQLTALLTHIADRTTQIVPPLAYAIINLSTFYLAIIFLAAGIVAHVRRTKDWGTYPGWRSDLPPSQVPTRWPSQVS